MRRPFTVAFLCFNALWSIALLAAPWLASPGAVRDLDGSANLIDHPDRWAALPVAPALAYAAGDLMCHQMETRSLHANDNQYPVDARMLAMFVAGNLGFLLAWRTRSRLLARDAFVDRLPAAWARRLGTPHQRLWGLTAFVLSGLVPVALDGFVQLLTSYESTNPLRVVTGVWLGFTGAAWLGLVFDALWHPAGPSSFNLPNTGGDETPAKSQASIRPQFLPSRRRYE